MANSEFELPDVGEGLTEAEIVSWKVKPGDTIVVNQVIVEIETAKSLVELPSPFAGTVSALLVAEGETVEVGTPIIASVQKTGRLVIAQEAPGFVSIGSEIAATVTERAFYSLEAPVLRVAAFDAPFPPAKLETTYLPDADRVLEAVDRAMAY